MKRSLKKRIMVVGPTATGKSDFAEKMAGAVGGEVINVDVCQMYEPLSIGTAKPDLSRVPVPHHLFSHISRPRNYSVAEFYRDALVLVEEIEQRGKVPIICGGSGFYALSLFFPPGPVAGVPVAAVPVSGFPVSGVSAQPHAFCYSQTYTVGDGPVPDAGLGDRTDFLANQGSLRSGPPRSSPPRWGLPHSESGDPIPPTAWELLHKLDPERAQKIHPHDAYRVERALNIYLTTGRLPSVCKPEFKDFNAVVFFINRDRDDLLRRISLRTKQMVAEGWLDEVRALEPAWRDFVVRKHVIGYPELLAYDDGALSLAEAREKIVIATRQYAKRQLTFFRKMKHSLVAHGVSVYDANLTLLTTELYLERYLREIFDGQQGNT